MRIIDYVRSKGVKARDLGVTPNLLIMVKHGKAKVSDRLLIKALKSITVDEFAKLVKGEEVKPSQASINNMVDAVLELEALTSKLKAFIEAQPQLGTYAHTKIIEALRNIQAPCIKVTEDQLKRFKRLVKASRAPGTARNHLIYLRRALASMKWELSPDRIQEHLIELAEQGSPHAARLTAQALKLFIKLIVKDPILYGSFKTPRVEPALKEPLRLEEVKAVAKAIEWPPAKAFYTMLAETGLRPGEILNLKLNNINLEERTVKPLRLSDTKRSYISFISTTLARYLKEVYLPYREAFIISREAAIKNLLRGGINEWRQLLYPFREGALRSAIYAAMDKALGWRFKLYELRAFYATYMSLKGIPGQVIDLLQGRVPPREYKILIQHYLAFNLEDLRRLYDKASLNILD